MKIRKLRQEEAARAAYPLFLAMKEIIYDFIGQESEQLGVEFLEDMIRKENNQYSFQNCWVCESEGEIVAAALVYDGGQLNELRAPVAQTIRQRFNKEFNPEDETQAGEYYIDSVGVMPEQQGRGIGSLIFKFLISEYVDKRNEVLGLLVDENNPGAKKLYLKLGFREVGEKRLAGKRLEHLQYIK